MNPNPAIGHWSGNERQMQNRFRERRSSPSKGFGWPPTPDLIRGRKPQGWGGAPAGFARGAGREWPSPSKKQRLAPREPETWPKPPAFQSANFG